MKKIDSIKLVNQQLRTLRDVFTDAGCIEIVTPSLEPKGPIPFQSPIQVTLNGVDALLSVAPDPYLVSAAQSAERVFTIANAFRDDDPSSNRLLEFRYAQAWLPGSLSDGMYLTERVFLAFLSEVLTRRMLPADRLDEIQTLQAPFRRLCYSDALSALGKQPNNKLVHDDHLQLCKLEGNRPIILIDFPPREEPSIFDAIHRKKNGDTVLAYFELIAPYAGEVGSGRQIETDLAKLQAQFSSSAYVNELKLAGQSTAPVDEYANLLQSFSGPLVATGVGLERMLQFFMGETTIENTVLFPVNRNRLSSVKGLGSPRG